jgi:hypothetical protein
MKRALSLYSSLVALLLLLPNCTAELPPVAEGRDDVVVPPYAPLPPLPPEQALNGNTPPVGQACVYWGNPLTSVVNVQSYTGGLIQIKTATASGAVTGQSITVNGVQGVPAANGRYVVTVLDPTDFVLAETPTWPPTAAPNGPGPAFSGSYVAGTGTVNQVDACDYAVGLNAADCGCNGVSGGTVGCAAPAPSCQGLDLGGCCKIPFGGETTEACFPSTAASGQLTLDQDQSNCEGAWGGTWTTTVP